MCTNSLSPLVLASIFALGTTVGFAQMPPPAGGVVGKASGPVSKNDPGYPILQVESDWEVSRAAAEQGAYRKALVVIDDYLRSKGHNRSGFTSPDSVKNISRNTRVEPKEFPGGGGTMFQAKTEVVLTPDVMHTIVAHERSLLAVTRMFWLGKLPLLLRVAATTGGAAVVAGVVFSLS
jgi:hypothetical protein